MFYYEFDIRKIIDAKNLLNKSDTIRQIYKRNCSYPHFVGNCTDLYYLLKPFDYLDFYYKYIENAERNKHLPIERRGLTYKELYELAEKFQSLVEESTEFRYDLSIYFYSLVCHIIVETFNGQKIEEIVMNNVKTMGFNVSKVNGSKDARQGIDIAVSNNDNKFYIQVKPISFFLSKKEDTQQDRISCCRKREKVMEMEGLDTYYMIYEMRSNIDELKWVIKDNGKKLFKISDLFSYDKNDISGTIINYVLPKKRIFQTYFNKN